jgi:hypothetical protein
MKEIQSWQWSETHIPKEDRWRTRTLCKVYDVMCVNPPDWEEVRMSDIALITGDGHCLPKDVKEFESWGIPHDVIAVNRSLLYFERPVQHWASIDNEETIWFTQNVSEKVIPPGRPIFRHTIGSCRGYDFWWVAGHPKDANEYAKLQWAGNSGYFGILIAQEMGYKRIVIAGMPLDNSPHWYDGEDVPGPNWIGFAYQQWMDYKMLCPKAESVRSMSGYTAFIFGKAEKEFILGG